ncbi:MAG: CbiX/SirB N-terminal domain-containing protein [Burkholderiales bacterium]|nr:CbiX/SirB N-terminal domain-containing protein [Burkholderiales bacterium]
MQRGLMLFAHGARDPRWALPFEAVARSVRERAPALVVQLAYLEFMAPGLVDAGHALAETGCGRVDVVPLFLGAGGHVRKDLPLLLAELARLHPQVTWQLRSAIGEVESVIDAMAQAALDLSVDEAPSA